MANMYLLLRDGRQSGPFTIGELLQQQLRSSDMIWIEGKSAAWCYLSEMQLTPVTAETIPDQSRFVHSSSNGDEIERKAEELRKRALTYTQQHQHERRDASSRPVIRQQVRNEDEVFHFVDHRKDRKSVAQEVFVSILIIGIFAASIYGGSSYFNNSQDVIPVAHKMEVTDQHTAIGKPSTIEKSPLNTLVQNTQDLQQTNMTEADSAEKVVVEKPKPVISKVAKKKVQDTTLKTEPVAIKEEEVIATPPVNNTEDLASKDIVVTEKKDSTVQTEKKKKGLRGLFKKKKKSDDGVE